MFSVGFKKYINPFGYAIIAVIVVMKIIVFNEGVPNLIKFSYFYKQEWLWKFPVSYSFSKDFILKK